jgi:hypothetical protein
VSAGKRTRDAIVDLTQRLERVESALPGTAAEELAVCRRRIAALEDEVAAKQRGYDDLHAMLDAAGIPGGNVWSRVGTLLKDLDFARGGLLNAYEWAAVKWACEFIPEARKTDGTPAADVLARLVGRR